MFDNYSVIYSASLRFYTHAFFFTISLLCSSTPRASRDGATTWGSVGHLHSTNTRHTRSACSQVQVGTRSQEEVIEYHSSGRRIYQRNKLASNQVKPKESRRKKQRRKERRQCINAAHSHAVVCLCSYHSPPSTTVSLPFSFFDSHSNSPIGGFVIVFACLFGTSRHRSVFLSRRRFFLRVRGGGGGCAFSSL